MVTRCVFGLVFVACAFADDLRAQINEPVEIHPFGGPSRIFTFVEEWRSDEYAANEQPAPWIAVLTRGDVVVPGQARQILHFSSTGKLQGSFGPSGTAADQFDGNIIYGGAFGDTIWAVNGPYSIAFVAPPSEFARSFAIEGAAELRRESGNVQFNWLFRAISSPSTAIALVSPFREGEGEFDPSLVRMGVLTLDGEIVRILAEYDPDLDFRQAYGASPPFPVEPIFQVSADGSTSVLVKIPLTGDAVGTYEVTAFDASGDTLFLRSHSFEAVPIPRSAVDSIIAVRTGPRETMYGQEWATTYRRAAVAFLPPFYPPVKSVVIGRDGTVWLRIHSVNGEENLYHVLSAEGDFLGTVSLPRNVRIGEAELGQAWGILSDNSRGVERIVKYRVLGLDRPPTN